MPDPDEQGSLATQHGRVILCATCYLDAEAAMSLATELAGQTGAALHGMLVHDTATLSASFGMASAVVSYSGVRATGVTMEDMLGAFRADARRFRDRLQRLARDASLSAAFQEAEGPLTAAVQATATPGDVIVFGFKPLALGAHDLVLVLEDNGTVPEFAQNLARKLNKQLVVMPLTGQMQQDMLDRLDRMAPAAVILVSANPDLRSLTRIIETARCPVIVSQPRGD